MSTMTSSRDGDDRARSAASPPVTVVVATRDRGARVVATIAGILNNEYPCFEVRVVDQSSDTQTQVALQSFLGDERFSYTRSISTGLATARNLAIGQATNEYIAITDDDCDVPPNWLRELVRAFDVHPQAAIIFGNVTACDHDSSAGFVPAYVRTEPFLARRVRQMSKVRGMGACMGIRRSAWQALCGFDPTLGAGASFKSCEDRDLALRALLAGYFVYRAPAYVCSHNGFRTWREGRSLARRDWYGIGACNVKLLKCGHWSVLLTVIYEFWGTAVAHFLQNIIFRRRLAEATPIIAYCQGFIRGLTTPVNRSNCQYLDRGPAVRRRLNPTATPR